MNRNEKALAGNVAIKILKEPVHRVFSVYNTLVNTYQSYIEINSKLL